MGYNFILILTLNGIIRLRLANSIRICITNFKKTK